MKGVMRHIKKCGFAYIKALPDRRSDMLSDIASGAGKSAFSEGTIELILSRKRKAAKKDGRVHAKK